MLDTEANSVAKPGAFAELTTISRTSVELYRDCTLFFLVKLQMSLLFTAPHVLSNEYISNVEFLTAAKILDCIGRIQTRIRYVARHDSNEAAMPFQPG